MSLLSRDVDYFLAICDTRSLARAADALGVSQPALTRTVQRLEARFGTRLFVRTPRGVEPTPIGSSLRDRVTRARVVLEDAEREAAQLAAGAIGRVRIGSGHLPARLVSRALFPRFIVERPAAQVQLHVAFDIELFELVDSGRLDFAVCGLLDTPPPSLVSRELMATDLFVVVREGHPLAKMRRPTLRDLLAYRAAAPGSGVGARQFFEARVASLGLQMPLHALESNSWDALLEAVATTDAYTFAPLDEVRRAGWQGRLVTLAIPQAAFALPYCVVTRVDAYRSPLTARAIELIEIGAARSSRQGGRRRASAAPL